MQLRRSYPYRDVPHADSAEWEARRGVRQGSIQGPALDQPEDLGGSNGKLDERIPAVFGEPSYNVLPR
jgi:hypothetical protein